MSINDLISEENYNICKELGFDIAKIKDYCNKNGIDYDTFTATAIAYSKSIDRSIVDIPQDEMLFDYENPRFYPYIQKYRNFILDRNMSFSSSFYYDIYKDIKRELFRVFYNAEFDKTTLEPTFASWNLDFQEHAEIVARYIINHLSKSTSSQDYDYKELLDKIRPLTDKRLETIPTFYDRLYYARGKDDVVEVIESSIQHPQSSRIFDFAMTYHKEDFDKVDKDLRRKFAMYAKYKQAQKEEAIKKKRDSIAFLREACACLEDYVNSNLGNVEDYCAEKNINMSLFRKYVALVEEKAPKVYDIYKNKTDSVRKKNYAIIVSTSKSIIEGIRNGVVENGEVRPFDLLDYYMTTNFERSTVLKAIRECSPADYKTFLSFIKKYYGSTLLIERDIKALYNDKIVFGVQLDKDDRVIPGSGHEVTREEKEFVIHYLNDNNVPLYDDVIKIAIKRHINGRLVPDNGIQFKKINNRPVKPNN